MLKYSDLSTLLASFKHARTVDELHEAMVRATRVLGFSQFAMGHHVDLNAPPEGAIRLTTYNEDWISHGIERGYFAEAGVKVFIVPHHRSRPDDFANWDHPNLFQAANVAGQAFGEGTWGGEFNSEFGPKEGDIVVKEHWAQSGFANTDLDLLLKQHGVRKLVFVGLIANRVRTR